MADSRCARVLAVGDAGADLAWLVSALAQGAPFEVEPVRGVLSACLALRRGTHGAVVADLETADEGALAIARAAGRSFPRIRALCLLPATAEPNTVTGLLEQAGVAWLRHPVEASALRTRVAEALAGFAAELERPANVSRLHAHEEHDTASLGDAIVAGMWRPNRGVA